MGERELMARHISTPAGVTVATYPALDEPAVDPATGAVMHHAHFWLVDPLHGQTVLHARCRDCPAVREFPVPVELGADAWHLYQHTDPELAALRREAVRARWT